MQRSWVWDDLGAINAREAEPPIPSCLHSSLLRRAWLTPVALWGAGLAWRKVSKEAENLPSHFHNPGRRANETPPQGGVSLPVPKGIHHLGTQDVFLRVWHGLLRAAYWLETLVCTMPLAGDLKLKNLFCQLISLIKGAKVYWL